jgi:hypothetical protein
MRVLLSHTFGRFDHGFASGLDVSSDVGSSVSLLGRLNDPAFRAESSPALARIGRGL